MPFIVDAAAQLPPPENLWRFTQQGADLVLFSGGKGLQGPQSSGLIVGKKSLIEAIAFNGPPNPFIGRGMKVGKEELVGLLARGGIVPESGPQRSPTILRRPGYLLH